jgi:hypothetical protein
MNDCSLGPKKLVVPPTLPMPQDGPGVFHSQLACFVWDRDSRGLVRKGVHVPLFPFVERYQAKMCTCLGKLVQLS